MSDISITSDKEVPFKQIIDEMISQRQERIGTYTVNIRAQPSNYYMVQYYATQIIELEVEVAELKKLREWEI